MKRENILINEDYTTKRVVATKFTAPGDAPAFDCSIHFGEESDDVTLQNCIIQANSLVKCSPDDTYDFETGALIALMKMCGREKALKAVEELYFLKETRGADFDGDVLESKAEYMAKENKRLEEENENLKKQKEQIIVAKNVLYNKLEKENKCLINTRDLLISKNNELIDKVKELEEENKEVLESDKYAKSEVGRLCFEKHRLEEENKMLCGKIKFLDKENRNLIYGGRQNGKQYTFLVDLFKKIPQNKVDEAYKEAYNTKLPLWQKEVLNQMYGIYKESKEKPELPRTLDNNGTVYRKSIQIKEFGEQINKLTVDSLIEQSRAFTRKCVDEWLYGPPTKREEMWENILALHKESDVIIKVKKEDINAFLHELENKIPEITWYSCVKIFETKYTIGDIYEELKTCNAIYFRLHKRNKLSYTSDSHIYPYRELKPIDYLPPMRWDLFKKGRVVVGVRKEHYDEFKEEINRQFGIINIHKPYDDFNYSFFIFDKNANFVEVIGRSQFRQLKEINKRKVVYWEDVR